MNFKKLQLKNRKILSRLFRIFKICENYLMEIIKIILIYNFI